MSGLPNAITEEEVRKMFSECGVIKSCFLKNPVQQQDQLPQPDGTKALQSLLPLYSIAYVNFENEEAALKAFDLVGGGPMSQMKVSYYQPQHNLIPRADRVADHGVINNTHYRVLFITKLNRRVS